MGVNAYNSIAGIVIVLVLVSCSLGDPLVGKWKSPDGSTFEFFADGTFMRREPSSGEFSGEYRFLPDKRLKLDVTMLGSRVMEIYEVVLAKDRITLSKGGSEGVPFYRIDGSTTPQEVVGLWKVSTESSKSRPYEDAVWRLGEGGNLLRRLDGSLDGIWFIRADDFYVAYRNGAYWKGDVKGNRISGKFRYNEGQSVEAFNSRRLSINPNDEATAFVACFGNGSSTLSCVDAERYSCNSFTGSSFAKLGDCIVHCRHEATDRGIRCLN